MNNQPIRRNWQKTKKVAGPAWADVYVSMNRHGHIMMTRSVFERLGSPKAVEILFDPATATIGLQRVSPAAEDAFHVGMLNKRSGQRRVNAMRTIIQFGLHVPETIHFHDAHFEHNRLLILELRTARVEPRVSQHWANKKKPEYRDDPTPPRDPTHPGS